MVINTMLNRSREVEIDTISLIVRTFDTGRPLTWRSCSWTWLLSACGSIRVRTTQAIGEIPTFSAFAAGAFAQDSSSKPSAMDRAALERWFEETMSGASLVGHFVVAGQDAPAQGEKYRISKIAKMS